MTPDDDPGWPGGISLFIWLVPGGLQWYLRRHRSDDGLVVLRLLDRAPETQRHGRDSEQDRQRLHNGHHSRR